MYYSICKTVSPIADFTDGSKRAALFRAEDITFEGRIRWIGRGQTPFGKEELLAGEVRAEYVLLITDGDARFFDFGRAHMMEIAPQDLRAVVDRPARPSVYQARAVRVCFLASSYRRRLPFRGD